MESSVRAASGHSQAYPEPAPRRLRPLIVLAIAAFIFFTLFFSTSSVTVSEVSTVTREAASKLPQRASDAFHTLRNPYRSEVHEPPDQRNSSSGGARWFSDWRWHLPFSSAVTHNDERTILPPLPERPAIYTYYDTTQDRDPEVTAAQQRQLRIWRRAWWAQGFKPIILGHAEAIKNPQYEALQHVKMVSEMQTEMMRWLAWGHMGTGLLANWLVLPMASRQDVDLAFLRRGQFTRLTRYEGFGNALYYAPASDIDKTIAAVIAKADLGGVSTVRALLEPDAFAVDAAPNGIVFYDSSTLNTQYTPVMELIHREPAKGYHELANLINAHLHYTFLASHPGGFVVLNPAGSNTALLASPAVSLAGSLATCPESPLPNACPPNQAGCLPCKSAAIHYPETLPNATDIFSVCSVPHPYTFSLLARNKPELEIMDVRRYSERDPWLYRVTSSALTRGISAYERVIDLKDWAGTESGRERTFWRTAEHEWPWRDLEWHFGFSLPGAPRATLDAEYEESLAASGGSNSGSNHQPIAADPEKTGAKSAVGASGSAGKKVSTALSVPKATTDNDLEVVQPLLWEMRRRPSRAELATQWTLFEAGRGVLVGNKGVHRFSAGRTNMRAAVEAWHMADTEAWRFVRALEARAHAERTAWEAAESRFKGTGVERE